MLVSKIRTRETTITAPLSLGQQALWFIHQAIPANVSYNIFTTTFIRSEIEIDRLHDALQNLLERHPILRTTYTTIDSEPVQQIHPHQTIDLEVIDTFSWTEAELNAQILAETDRPFNLEQGPILRVTLFSRATTDHILLLTMHQIAGDMGSFDLLLNELQILYAGGTLDTLPQSRPYKDYVRWQLELLASDKGEQLWQYWQKQLAGELPTLDLPIAKPRPLIQTYQGAIHPFTLDPATLSAIQSLVSQEDVTLYTVLLSVFQVLLYRYSRQEDLIVGLPLTGRMDGQFQETIGYFSNPVPLRTTVAENIPFRQFLHQTHQVVLEAQAYKAYPFPLLVKRLSPPRDPSRSPIFQVSFTAQKQRWCETKPPLSSPAPQLQMEPYLLGYQRGAAFDLDLMMLEAGKEFQLFYQYNLDLFDPATIERMVGHYQTLLSSILVHPDQQISELPLLTKTEREQILLKWNQTQIDYPSHLCVHHLFEAQVKRTPEAIAVTFEGKHFTYQQLNDRANQLAHYLRSIGVGPNERIGICVERSLEMAVGFLGIFKAGAAYVPIDPAYPAARRNFMLEDAQPLVLLTQERLLEHLSDVATQTICLDTDWSTIAQYPSENPALALSSDHLAYIIYTSGSTGKPKGVMIPHRALVNHNLAIVRLFGLQSDDRVLQSASISFDIAVEEIFPTWISGGTLVLRNEAVLASVSTFLQFVGSNQITVLNLPTALWHEVVNGMRISGDALPDSVRLMVVGGEKATKETYGHWWNLVGDRCRWINTYGPTETTVSATFYEPVPHSEQQFSTIEIPIGRPLANTEVYVLDQYLRPVAIGIPGELHIGGAGVAQGYLNRPELTALKFIPNPFTNASNACLYKTGDLVRYLSDGNLEFLGRIDDQVKIRGFRIELGEIETCLNQNSQVKESVVLAREDTLRGKQLVAYVVPLLEQKITDHDLRSWLTAKLPNYMIPAHFVILDVLPLTPNGKIDRRALPAPQTDQQQSSDAFVAPQNQLEFQLQQIWEDVLGIRPIGIRDNFFELGGHSLIALRLITAMERVWPKNISLATFLQAPTIEAFAAVLQQAEITHWSSLVPIKPSGSKPPLFCIHALGGNVLEYHPLAHQLGEEQPVYGLQSLGLDGRTRPLERIEEMAAHYIQEMRSFQPNGPYFLAGYSFGGWVAFEMAQQLKTQGQQVALLALLDIHSPNLPGIRPSLLKTIQIHVSNLQQMESKDKMKYVKDRILFWLAYRRNYKDLLLDNWAEPLPPAYLNVLETNFHAGQDYKAQLYSGKAVLFRCQIQELTQAIYSDLGWKDLVADRLEVHDISGNHNNLLKEPYVQSVAEKLKIYLESEA